MRFIARERVGQKKGSNSGEIREQEGSDSGGFGGGMRFSDLLVRRLEKREIEDNGIRFETISGS